MEKEKQKLESAIQLYVDKFCKKHGLDFDFWVADLTGSVGCFSNDYYVGFETIRLDLETKQPKGKFFEWYDFSLGKSMEGKGTINYYSYLKMK